MNILFFFPEENSYMGQWQKYHILDELKHQGHAIHLFNPLLFQTFEQANHELIRFIKNSGHSFDLFVNSLGSDQLLPDTVKEIKKAGIATLLICFDNLYAPFMHKTSAPLFDLVWLTSKETQEMFIRWGCTVVFMPYAANPEIFKPNFVRETECVGFIGIPYGSRINKINKLVNNQIQCQIHSSSVLDHGKSNPGRNNYLTLIKSGLNLTKFGIGRKILSGALKNKVFVRTDNTLTDNPFLKRMPSVSFEEMIHLYSNFEISLGITEVRNTYTLQKPVHKLHLRTFEIPMCGGIQLSSYTEELSGYFEDDKEILLYKSDEEMISKAKFFLNPERKGSREKIRLNARKRAENEHTWTNRFNVVFSMLFQ